ncbi:hypothetical protein HAX54_032718, partial [Datura stramonium]|nr:hypothetical protein [Datura stramonium]
RQLGSLNVIRVVNAGVVVVYLKSRKQLGCKLLIYNVAFKNADTTHVCTLVWKMSELLKSTVRLEDIPDSMTAVAPWRNTSSSLYGLEVPTTDRFCQEQKFAIISFFMRYSVSLRSFTSHALILSRVLDGFAEMFLSLPAVSQEGDWLESGN